MNSAFLGQCCLLNYHCRRLNRKPCSTWKTSVTFSLQQKHSMQGTSPGQRERGNGSVPKAVHSGTNIPSGRGGGVQEVSPWPPLSFPSCCLQLFPPLQLMILETASLAPFSSRSSFPPAIQPATSRTPGLPANVAGAKPSSLSLPSPDLLPS